MRQAGPAARRWHGRMIGSFGQPFEAQRRGGSHQGASIGIAGCFRPTVRPPTGCSRRRARRCTAPNRAGATAAASSPPQMNLVARRTGLLEHELRQAFERRPVHRALPAAARSEDRAHRRGRGPTTLAASPSRHGSPDRVHRACRGHRADRASDRTGPRPGMPAAEGVAARGRDPRAPLGQSLPRAVPGGWRGRS